MTSSSLPQLVRVVDRLADQDTLAQQQRHRDQLIESATQVCADQGMVLTAAQVVEAVDAELSGTPILTDRNSKAEPLTDPQDVLAIYGWDRPTSQEAWAARDAQSRKGWRKFLRKIYTPVMATSFGLSWMIAWFLVALLWESNSVYYILWIGSFPTAFALWFLAPCFSKTILDIEDCDPFLPDLEMQRSLAKASEARALVQRCLNSPVPMILKGDMVKLRALVTRHELDLMEAKRQARSPERLQENLRKTFGTLPEG